MKFIIFFHGFGFPSKRFGIRYWGDIPEKMEAGGFFCFHAPTAAFDSSEYASQKAVAFIRKNSSLFLNHPIYLVGHSRGGIDALLTASILTKEVNIVSVFCINSPIQGATIAKKIIKKYSSKSFFYKSLNLIGKIFGDKNPDSYESLRQLSLDWSKKIPSFTKIILYESKYSILEMNWLWRKIAFILYGKEVLGDGMVDFNTSQFNQPNVEIYFWNSLSTKVVYHWSMLRWPKWLGGKRIDLAPLLLSNLSKL